MKLWKYFDPTNKAHMEAYVHFSNNDWWPKSFIEGLPKDIEFSSDDEGFIRQRLANTWIEIYPTVLCVIKVSCDSTIIPTD